MTETVQTPEAARSVFTIRTDHYGFFLAKFEKLARKAKKLNTSPISVEIIETIEKKVGKNWDGKDRFEPFYVVKVVAEPVKVEGYTFVATIDHANEAGNIIRSMPNTGVDLPESYRTAKPFCQHCNSMRTRRNTMILRCDATGDLKQIGKNCLADFIGRDPKELARRAEWLAEIAAMGDSDDDYDGPNYMKDRRTIDLLTFLGHTATMIRIYGWVSAGMVKNAGENSGLTSTRGRAYENMFPPKNYKTGEYEKTDPVTDEDKALAAESLAWALTLGDKPRRSDYENNLWVLAQTPYIEWKSAGLVASMVSGLLREREKLVIAKREVVSTIESTHIGAEKERIEFGKVRVSMAYSGPSGDWFVHRYTFVTEAGNVLEWSASSSQGLMKGDVVKLVGTVKGHNEYKGVKRTKSTRCKIEKVAA